MNEKFCLTIDYDMESPDPEHVFYGVGKLLESMKNMDKAVASCNEQKSRHFHLEMPTPFVISSHRPNCSSSCSL